MLCVLIPFVRGALNTTLWVLQFPPPNKNDRHDLTEILLKVEINTLSGSAMTTKT